MTKREKFEVQDPYFCPECKNGVITDSRTGDTVCGTCGLVIDEKFPITHFQCRDISLESERRKHNFGFPSSYSMFDKGLPTKISWYNKDYKNAKITPKKVIQFKRLRKWDNRSINTKRNLTDAMCQLDTICAIIGASFNIKETAAIIYRKADKKMLSKGRSIRIIAAASLYASCRIHKKIITYNKFCSLAGVSKKDLNKSFSLLVRELNLKKLVAYNAYQFVPGLASLLKLSETTINRAFQIIEIAFQNIFFKTKNPITMAASAIYIASIIENEFRTQDKVTKAAQISEPGLRNVLSPLEKYLNLSKRKPGRGITPHYK